MTLEKTDVIDMITRPAPGKLGLFIVDAGVTTDPDERYNLLLEKFGTYLNYVMRDNFKQQYPGVAPTDVTITVIFSASAPPTQQMRETLFISPRGDRINRIPVVFMEIEEFGRSQASASDQ